MKAIAGAKITFTKADFLHFSDGQTKVLYVFAHILNRSKLLETQIFSQWHTVRDTKRSRIEQDAALFGVFEFLLLLAGELKEGWEAIERCYFSAQLSRTLNAQLPTEVQASLKRLNKQHFNGTSIINRLRNDFSYHHSPDKILSTARILANDEPHIAYLFGDGNNYFDYATKLRIAAVAESLGLLDWHKVVEHLNAIVNEVYHDMSTTLNSILVALVNTINPTHESTELPRVPSDDDLSGNFFFYVT